MIGIPPLSQLTEQTPTLCQGFASGGPVGDAKISTSWWNGLEGKQGNSSAFWIFLSCNLLQLSDLLFMWSFLGQQQLFRHFLVHRKDLPHWHGQDTTTPQLLCELATVAKIVRVANSCKHKICIQRRAWSQNWLNDWQIDPWHFPSSMPSHHGYHSSMLSAICWGCIDWAWVSTPWWCQVISFRYSRLVIWR